MFNMWIGPSVWFDYTGDKNADSSMLQHRSKQNGAVMTSWHQLLIRVRG